MSDARRVLVVSFFFPPDPAVGGLRVGKFVRHLPEFGWEPTVLTARTVETPTPDERVHATAFASPWKLLRRRRATGGESRPASVSLGVRASRGPLRRRVYAAFRHVLPMSSVRMPDATIGWLPYAVERGRQLLAEGGFDAIFSSSGPPSSHMVAARLQRASGLPWIADYRDLWSDNHWDYRVAPFRWAERGFERRILRRASLLTTVSPTLARRLADLHRKPAKVVFNGFDPADYPEAPVTDPDFTVTYVGSLYWPDQDPTPLLAALALVKDRPGIDLDGLGFRLQFLGTEPASLPALARRHGVDRWVRFAAGVPHLQSLARQTRSTALAFFGWSDPNAGIISAKIFEYLGAGRPILAVGPPGGAASAILKECGMADLSNDPQEIAHRLESWLLQFQQSRTLSFNRNPQAIAAYTRRAQTGHLAGLLDRVSQEQLPVD